MTNKKSVCAECEEKTETDNMLECVDCGDLFCEECVDMGRVPQRHSFEECDYEIE